jgi:hypothetical protein
MAHGETSVAANLAMDQPGAGMKSRREKRLISNPAPQKYLAILLHLADLVKKPFAR